MENTILIDTMKPEDWNRVRQIYLEGIATGNATFQKEAPSWENWDRDHISECRVVARSGDTVMGWAALSPVSSRCVYNGVAEVSVYVGSRSMNMGVGSMLLHALIESSEQHGYWTLQSGIFPENPSSIGLHKKYHFREIGVREKVGKMDGVWRDVVLLERRSRTIGVE